MLPKENTSQEKDALAFTGERYTPEIGGSIELEHLHRYIFARQAAAGKIVLDIACGEGYGSAILAKTAHHVYGVDIAPDAVEHAQVRYGADNIEFKCGSASDIPMKDASVDMVVSFETIEHHDQHEAMLREIKRVLKPGGVLILSSPDKFECTDKTGYTNPHHVKELYREEFVDLVNVYFANFRLFGQRVLYASAILAEDDLMSVHSYHLDNDQEKGVPGVTAPLFFIAVASDGDLPSIASGLLEQPIMDIEEIKIREMIIADRETQLLAYQQNYFLFKNRPLYYILRAVYRRFPVLQKLRHVLQRWRGVIKESIWNFGDARDNVRALQAMADRRFDEAAIETAVPAPKPSEWPELDVSIVTYNSELWLDVFFTSLTAQQYPLEKLHVHIVDNGSTDGTASKIETFLAAQKGVFAESSFIRQSNKGFGAGHDKGIQNGSSAYCLVTNVDIEFLPNSLCNVVSMALADTREEVGSWELRQYPYEHPKHYDPVTLETSWSSHACVLLRRSAYEKCGGYDPAIFMYAEDVELSYRLRSYGYILKYAPAAAVIHHAYEDIATIKPAQYIGSIAGNLYVRLRYGNAVSILAALFMVPSLLLKSEPFTGARKALAQRLFSLLPSVWRIRAMKGPVKTSFPFRGLDYEVRRDGAFVKAYPLPLAPEDMPEVSVLIRTYKGRGFLLRQAIQTVFNQTYPALEIVVSEDGGDTQRQVVEEMACKAPNGMRVVYLENPKQGRSATGNAALRNSTAPYFVFLDDDDLLYADHIETLLRALLEHPECPVAYAPGMEVVTDMSLKNATYVEKCFRRMEVLHQPWDYDVMREHNFMVISSLVRRELYEARGGLDTELEMLEDWNLWIRYGCGNTFAYVPKATMLFRTPFTTEVAFERAQAIHAAYQTAKQRAFAFSCKRLDS